MRTLRRSGGVGFLLSVGGQYFVARAERLSSAARQLGSSAARQLGSAVLKPPSSLADALVVCTVRNEAAQRARSVGSRSATGEKMTNAGRCTGRCPPLSPNPFTLSRKSGGRGIVGFSLDSKRASPRSLHLRTELERRTSPEQDDDDATGSDATDQQQQESSIPGRWRGPMAARSPLQQRSSESSISDRARTSSGSASTRVELARRLTRQVYVGAMEVPPDAVGIDKPAPGQLTVAVKVRALTLDSGRNGGGGLRTWQEWRTVQRLLALEREADNYVLRASSALSRDRDSAGRRVLDGRRHIIRYYATSVESESFRLIMEYCPGGDLLSQLISRGALGAQPSQRVSQQEARRWVLQLARGLRYLHASGIAHRDLCPENILVGRTGDVKICNFGASTTRAAELSRDRVAGNLHYTAPEAVSGTWYDPVRGDVWSLGAVFFVLLTGSPLLRLPFPECRGFELVKTVGCRGVLRLWNMDHLFSAATMDLLAKMLAVDPAKRLGSMREVLEHPAMLATAHTERSLIAV